MAHQLTADQLILFYFLIMFPTTVGSIARACGQKDYQLAIFVVSVFVEFYLIEWCVCKFICLPPNEKSSRRKFWLKFAIWFLYSAISFGFVYQFMTFFSLEMTMVLLGVVMAGSAFLFYAFIIQDHVKGSDSVEEIGVVEDKRLEGGKLKDSDLVWEKV